MAALRDIKRRITSVKNTSQITKAMQMVSASKMQKAQDRALKAIPYATGIYRIVNKLRGGMSDYTSVYLKQSKTVKNVAIVVVGMSRGFVGGQMATLTAEVYRLHEKLKQKYPGVEVSGISIHKTGQKVLANAGIKSKYHFAEFIEVPTTTELTPVFSLLIDKFSLGDYDEIHIVYTHFKNTLNQVAQSKKLLPLSLEEIIEEAKEGANTYTSGPDFKYEPDIKSVLDRLLPEYFQTQIYTGILESIASEHSARMVAMKNATDNAHELEKKLTLKYNRSRQTAITSEIIEVISGSLS